MSMKITVLGTGKMGVAMVRGLIRKGTAPETLKLTNTSGRLPDALADTGVCCLKDNAAAVREADFIIMAVLPQQYPAVLEEICPAAREGACLISIAPGFKVERLNALTGGKLHIVRAMPNTPALVGEGMIAVCLNGAVPEAVFEQAKALLSALGQVETVSEAQLNAVIGISGSAPAYVYMFADALADAGVLGGLHRDQAARMVAQMLYGSAALLRESGRSAAELREMVCSPAGTTIEAVAALEEDAFRGTVIRAARAAMRKAEKMG